MNTTRVHCFSISLDGFGTGQGQTFEAPFGHAGERLHEWMFAAGESCALDDLYAQRHFSGIGAEIMARGKWGPRDGTWGDAGSEDEWRGWWGPNPPFHTPVFVLTHTPRPSIEMEGGNVFHFVDVSPAEALDMAREAAGELDVRIGGGVSMLRDFLLADLVDFMHIAVVPIVLGRGERLWDGLEGLDERFDVETVASPSGVTHLTFTRA